MSQLSIITFEQNQLTPNKKAMKSHSLGKGLNRIVQSVGRQQKITSRLGASMMKITFKKITDHRNRSYNRRYCHDFPLHSHFLCVSLERKRWLLQTSSMIFNSSDDTERSIFITWRHVELQWLSVPFMTFLQLTDIFPLLFYNVTSLHAVKAVLRPYLWNLQNRGRKLTGWFHQWKSENINIY